MPVKHRVYESMTRVEVGGYVVRVWMDEVRPLMGPNRRVVWALDFFKDPTVEDIIARLDALEPAAFEVLRGGQGLVVYPDWG